MTTGIRATRTDFGRRSAPARWLAMTQDATLVVVSALFFYVHAMHVLDGRFTSIPFALEQALLVGMFLMRRRSMATSTRPFDWLVAAGGWLPLLMRPTDGGPAAAEAVGVALQVGGLAFTCVAFLYLGRSFGVVAANRGLKIKGPYRLVRHPIYFSHVVTTTGFLVANPTQLNLCLFVVLTACQVLRIHAEERVLTATGDYAAYRARVRWRLLPFVY